MLSEDFAALITERVRLQAQILGDDVAAIIVQAGLFVQIQLVRRLQATAVVIDISGIDVQRRIAGNLALVDQLTADLQAAGDILAQRQNLALVSVADAGRRQLQILAGLDQANSILQLADRQLELAITAQQTIVAQ